MSDTDAPVQESPQEPPAAAPDASATAPARASPRYDISSKERVVDARMPTMEIVNARFARHFQSGLFGLLRRHADVVAGPLAVHKHSAFMSQLTPAAALSLVAVRPLRGSGLVVCEGPLLYGLVEALYGGPCRLRTDLDARELSATEQRVLTRLVNLVCQEYKKAWKGIHPLELEHQRLETLPQFASIAGPNEAVVSTAFSLTVGELTGTLHICMPYTSLEPLRDVLYASPLGDAESVDRRWSGMLTREIQAAEVTLVAQLATADVTVEQLLSMKPGDFIELDRTALIDASVDNVPLFRCHYGTNGGKYALRIDQCLTSNGEHHGQ